jgi:hypothetical protein
MAQLHLVHKRDSVDRSIGPLDPELKALLQHGRIITPLPRVVRTRAIARARAAIAAAAERAPPGALRRGSRC